MVQLQKDLEKISAKGIKIAGISYDSVETLAKFTQKRSIRYPLISDPKSAIIEAYGLKNPQRTDGLSLPGTVILSKEGKIVAKWFYEGYRERHTTEDLLSLVSSIPQKAP